MCVRFLWPCIVSKAWRERKNRQDATIRCLLSTSVSTCFGHHYAILQENKRTCYCIWCTALVLLDVVGSGCGALRCRMWAVLASYSAAPHCHCVQHGSHLDWTGLALSLDLYCKRPATECLSCGTNHIYGTELIGVNFECSLQQWIYIECVWSS